MSLKATNCNYIGPSLDEIEIAMQYLTGRIVRTPCVDLLSERIIRVGVIACGANIGEQKFIDFVSEGRKLSA